MGRPGAQNKSQVSAEAPFDELTASDLWAQAPALAPSDFAEISRLAREHFGLNLRRGKEDLVSARLAKRLRQGKFKSFSEYLDHVRADRTGKALIGLIDSLSTNHTAFFREPQHFHYLNDHVFSNWTWGPLRIWSAACSTGEEAYSIVCAAAVHHPAILDNLRVLATDISTRSLDSARAGVYAKAAVDATAREYVAHCFLNGYGRSESYYRVRPKIARLVEFQRLNLIEPIPLSERFHVIFCRNVLMYFDTATQQAVVRSLAARLEPGGLIFVGHSESLTGIRHELTYVQPAIYRAAT